MTDHVCRPSDGVAPGCPICLEAALLTGPTGRCACGEPLFHGNVQCDDCASDATTEDE
jgi:hypothetical protein